MTAEQRESMMSEYRAGKSAGFLSRKYGCCESYPRALAHREGFKRDYSWHEDVRKAAARGVRISTLARRYNRTWQRIWQIARAA